MKIKFGKCLSVCTRPCFFFSDRHNQCFTMNATTTIGILDQVFNLWIRLTPGTSVQAPTFGTRTRQTPLTVRGMPPHRPRPAAPSLEGLTATIAQWQPPQTGFSVIHPRGNQAARSQAVTQSSTRQHRRRGTKGKGEERACQCPACEPPRARCSFLKSASATGTRRRQGPAPVQSS